MFLEYSNATMMPMVFWASLPPCPRLYAAADASCRRQNTPSTRAGVAWRNSHITASMITNPPAIPISGARKMNLATLTMPLTITAFVPTSAIPAPARPQIKACDEDVGSPRYQVSRFHSSAPTTAASTIAGVTTEGSTMPLPMVLATCTPNTRNAMKLNPAAHATAIRGGSTRVLTTVAMELAASWNPLLKSNASATTMMMTTSIGQAMVSGS